MQLTQDSRRDKALIQSINFLLQNIYELIKLSLFSFLFKIVILEIKKKINRTIQNNGLSMVGYEEVKSQEYQCSIEYQPARASYQSNTGTLGLQNIEVSQVIKLYCYSIPQEHLQVTIQFLSGEENYYKIQTMQLNIVQRRSS